DIGLAWFQYDTQPGTSDWSNNTLSDLSTAGIYVCGTGQDCLQPLESFSITGNTIKRAAAALILERTSGSYSVSGNSLP
ncbi:MAG: hypothetical protein ACYC0H_13115, partial [Solirubrobacteraceae bacterium]